MGFSENLPARRFPHKVDLTRYGLIITHLFSDV